MDQAAVARHRLEATEAWKYTVCRAATPRRRPGPGGTNRQPTWPLAALKQPRPLHGNANRLLRFIRPAFRRDPQTAQSTEPPYTDPYVRWCGRGGAVRLPPIPITAQSRIGPPSGGLTPRTLGLSNLSFCGAGPLLAPSR